MASMLLCTHRSVRVRVLWCHFIGDFLPAKQVTAGIDQLDLSQRQVLLCFFKIIGTPRDIVRCQCGTFTLMHLYFCCSAPSLLPVISDSNHTRSQGCPSLAPTTSTDSGQLQPPITQHATLRRVAPVCVGCIRAERPSDCCSADLMRRVPGWRRIHKQTAINQHTQAWNSICDQAVFVPLTGRRKLLGLAGYGLDKEVVRKEHITTWKLWDVGASNAYVRLLMCALRCRLAAWESW